VLHKLGLADPVVAVGVHGVDLALRALRHAPLLQRAHARHGPLHLLLVDVARPVHVHARKHALQHLLARGEARGGGHLALAQRHVHVEHVAQVVDKVDVVLQHLAHQAHRVVELLQ